MQPQVLVYSSANLFAALSNKHRSQDRVAEHEGAQYLYRYLSDLGAQTIVVEPEYTDGDYLEDFAAYYVRCFEPYERLGTRLHFFAVALTEEQVSRLILRECSVDECDSITRSYLGFVVARPLPSAIIGRTVLAVPDADGGRRHYPVLHECHANFFGIDLTVLSLPFQEQDRVLAACATVALWSAFRQTAKQFGTAAPRPAEITRLASAGVHRGRAVPSSGLSLDEMCHAVSEVGLEPEFVDCRGTNLPVASLLYAYLCAGMPVILIVDVEKVGLHAITLVGYSMQPSRVRAAERIDGHLVLPMRGLRIDRFYGHDDQIGPFARLEVVQVAPADPITFRGSWKTGSGAPAVLTPHSVLVPLYNKIRLTFIHCAQWLERLTRVVSAIIPATEDFEWDMRLTTTNAFKREVASLTLDTVHRERLLRKPLPRFLWRATLSVRGAETLDLLFDATDIPGSVALQELIWRDVNFKAAMEVVLRSPAMQASLTECLTAPFLAALKKDLDP